MKKRIKRKKTLLPKVKRVVKKAARAASLPKVKRVAKKAARAVGAG
jgi:hypothetical protein